MEYTHTQHVSNDVRMSERVNSCKCNMFMVEVDVDCGNILYIQIISFIDFLCLCVCVCECV